MLEAKDIYWVIEYIGYYNFIILLLILYIAYYLLSNSFMFIMFLVIGIIIGVYLSSTMRTTLKLM
jgi:hypothetical protein